MTRTYDQFHRIRLRLATGRVRYVMVIPAAGR